MPSSWETPIKPNNINTQDIHVWRAKLNDYTKPQLQDFFNTLDAEEKKRALRFHFTKDQERFTAARAILRIILGNYLKCDPTKIEFTYNAYGKPALLQQDMQFNLAHSKDYALYAFSPRLTVGIDIEHINTDHDMDAIAQRFFSVNEYRVLKNLSQQQKTHAFYNAWTRKEAFLKAIGQGLSYPLADVEVSILPEEKPRFIQLGNPSFNIKEWSLFALPTTENYAAALAVQGKVELIKTWDWVKFAP